MVELNKIFVHNGPRGFFISHHHQGLCQLCEDQLLITNYFFLKGYLMRNNVNACLCVYPSCIQHSLGLEKCTIARKKLACLISFGLVIVSKGILRVLIFS
jgi:hypothetical protein